MVRDSAGPAEHAPGWQQTAEAVTLRGLLLRGALDVQRLEVAALLGHAPARAALIGLRSVPEAERSLVATEGAGAARRPGGGQPDDERAALAAWGMTLLRHSTPVVSLGLPLSLATLALRAAGEEPLAGPLEDLRATGRLLTTAWWGLLEVVTDPTATAEEKEEGAEAAEMARSLWRGACQRFRAAVDDPLADVHQRDAPPPLALAVRALFAAEQGARGGGSDPVLGGRAQVARLLFLAPERLKLTAGEVQRAVAAHLLPRVLTPLPFAPGSAYSVEAGGSQREEVPVTR